MVNTSETIQTGARTAQQSLLSVSSDVGAQLKLTSAEVEAALTAVGTGAANSILTSARDAQATLVSASSEAARQIKSLAADVERTLSAAGDATAASILAGAREAQTTLVTASADAANHVKSLAADVERSLSIAGMPPPKPSPPAPAKPRARWSPRHGGRQPGQDRSQPTFERSLSIAGNVDRRGDHRGGAARPRAR